MPFSFASVSFRPTRATSGSVNVHQGIASAADRALVRAELEGLQPQAAGESDSAGRSVGAYSATEHLSRTKDFADFSDAELARLRETGVV